MGDTIAMSGHQPGKPEVFRCRGGCGFETDKERGIKIHEAKCLQVRAMQRDPGAPTKVPETLGHTEIPDPASTVKTLKDALVQEIIPSPKPIDIAAWILESWLARTKAKRKKEDKGGFNDPGSEITWGEGCDLENLISGAIEAERKRHG
nr:hypothetical protein [Candidatus Sigynarchaeota archaeon]